ncbi:hypothetical protein Vafri_21068 [Volvox africanus]|nr:hypothetical protein Vafri_21068 [Volvox africanus]
MQQLQLEQQQQQHGSGNGGNAMTGSPRAPSLPVLPPLGLVDHRTSNTFNLHIKIADFGLSKRAAHSLPKTRVGTINYMAPEVLLAGPSQRYDGHKADIWSAGVVLYAMLFSRVPFEVMHEPAQQGQGQGQPGARDRAATIQRILEGDWSVPPGMSVTPQCLHLLTQMLVPNPARRISMAAIMEHPWFRSGLPPAALTMNTALVRQQAAQSGGPAAGEQTEGEIDEILEVLRRHAAAETEAAVAAALAASHSRSSDDAAEERRAFELKGIEEDEEQPAPPAAATTRRLTQRTADERQGRYPQEPSPPGGGTGGAAAAAAAAARPVSTLAAVAPQDIRSGGNGPQETPAAASPNAFLARLALLRPCDIGADGGGAGGVGAGGPDNRGRSPGCCNPAIYGAGGGGVGVASAGAGAVPLMAGSSASRRAEALEAIDCIDIIAGRG